MTILTAAAVEPELVAYLQKEGGWGPWIKVTVAATPEADAAAAAFFRRATVWPRPDGEKYHTGCVDEEASAPGSFGPAMADIFDPSCEHGMSAHLCYGPDHFPSREQEMQNGW
jgi:hypothetical protein